MTPEKYCKKIVKASASNFYYSFLFLPKRKRRAMYAFYAFSRVIDDVVDEGFDMEYKEKMIAFWRSEVDKCYEGHSEHPLTKELVYAIKTFDIPKEYLVDLLNGVTQDMVQNRFATYEDLKKYCYRVASVVGLVCLKIFEVEDNEKNREAAINLGLAFQVTNIIRDVKADAEIDRIYLPEEDLQKFGVTEADIMAYKYTDGFVQLMKFEWDKAYEYFHKAWSGFDKSAKRKLVSAMIMADIYYEILLRIKKVGYNVFENRVRVSNGEKIKMALKRFTGLGCSREDFEK